MTRIEQMETMRELLCEGRIGVNYSNIHRNNIDSVQIELTTQLYYLCIEFYN